MSSGVKYDDGKAPIFRGLLELFPRAVSEVARVSAFGASKYSWINYRNVDDGFYRYSDALVRHLTRERTDEGVDPDSGFLHATHVAWNSLSRLEALLEERELGHDRYEQTRPEGPEACPTQEPYSPGPTKATCTCKRTEKV